MVRDECVAHKNSWVWVIYRKWQYVNNPWLVCLLVCAVGECFPSLSFSLGLEMCFLFICTLQIFVNAGKIPDST